MKEVIFIQVFICSEKGSRKDNQDSVFFNQYVINSDDFLSMELNYEKDNNSSLFGIFDGAGGQEGGKRVSVSCAKALKNYYLEKKVIFQNDLRQFLQTLNWSVCQENQELDEMGASTATIGIIDKESILHLWNIGDSPAYLFRAGKVDLISELHNLAGIKLQRGEITHNEYDHMTEESSLLLGCIGCEDEIFNEYLYYDEIKLKKKDILLICSDGLEQVVGRKRLYRLIQSHQIRKLNNIIKRSCDILDSDNSSYVLIYF